MRRIAWLDPGGRVIHVEHERTAEDVTTSCGAVLPVARVVDADDPRVQGRAFCKLCKFRLEAADTDPPKTS